MRSVVITLSVGRFDSRGIHFCEDRNISVPHSDPTGFGPWSVFSQWVLWATSAGLIRPGHEADHSLLSSRKFKNVSS